MELLISTKQRRYALLLAAGASILLTRTLIMLLQGAVEVLVAWVSSLLIAEMLVDVACLITSIRWWVSNEDAKAGLPLRLGAAAALLHALRVLIFVLGRTTPFLNFDVKPEHWTMHATRWSWFWVYFAAALSILGVIGVIVIWRIRRRTKIKNENENDSRSKTYFG